MQQCSAAVVSGVQVRHEDSPLHIYSQAYTSRNTSTKEALVGVDEDIMDGRGECDQAAMWTVVCSSHGAICSELALNGTFSQVLRLLTSDEVLIPNSYKQSHS